MSREAQTKARHLIDGASFGPEALKAIGEAFDAAWAEVSGNFGDDMVDVDKARRRLAKALLSIANDGGSEASRTAADGARLQAPQLRGRLAFVLSQRHKPSATATTMR